MDIGQRHFTALHCIGANCFVDNRPRLESVIRVTIEEKVRGKVMVVMVASALKMKCNEDGQGGNSLWPPLKTVNRNAGGGRQVPSAHSHSSNQITWIVILAGARSGEPLSNIKRESERMEHTF